MRLPPLARWALVVAIVLMGGALAMTAWYTHAGVTNASDSLVRGESESIWHDVRAHLGELGHPATDADLAEVLADHSGDGLELVATLDADNHLIAFAGKPSQDPASLAASLADLQNDTPVRIGGRVRVVFRGPPRRRRDHDGGPPRSGWSAGLLIEFQPLEAQELRETAARTLLIGVLAAGTLLVIALFFVRWFMRRAAIDRELERDRRLASLGQLSAVLAHEIRNPLASLKGNAQLLAQMLPAGEKPRSKADRVVDEAIRLEVLTNDLLEFARTGELHRAAVEPARLLAECAASVSPDIQLDSAAAPARFSLDPERIRQVLTNLLENAVQAGMPVKASVATEGGRLVFEIMDSGPGVPPEDRAHLFEPFFTTKTRGTGLGLAVVKRVIELHEGTISVDNGPGGGARFRVTLPKG